MNYELSKRKDCMKAVIIEDETAAVGSLKAILAQNSIIAIEVIAELESIEESVAYFREEPHPDIIFMDIHLADGSAFKIFEQVEIEAPRCFYNCLRRVCPAGLSGKQYRLSVEAGYAGFPGTCLK